MNNQMAKVIASFAGVGYFPFWSGAAGSAAGLAIAWYSPQPVLWGLLALFTGLGFWACAPSERAYGTHDSQRFVMDEVCGMFISVLWLPKTLPLYLAAFLLFRFFDTLKPWPIILIQRHRHPHTIMWDDLAAGAASWLCLQAWLWLAP